MNEPRLRTLSVSCLIAVAVAFGGCGRSSPQSAGPDPVPMNRLSVFSTQTTNLTPDEIEFFAHGSMGTEVVPIPVYAAFRKTYPDLFPGDGFFGLVPDPEVGVPLGVSRRAVEHLGDLEAIGINCAACHATEIRVSPDEPARVLMGAASHFDAGGFFVALVGATFRTSDPTNMQRYLAHYFDELNPNATDADRSLFRTALKAEKGEIERAVLEDPYGTGGLSKPGHLHKFAPNELLLTATALREGRKLADLASATLKLFHNMRAALHVGDVPPKAPPPASGYGRNDAFGLLAYEFFNIVTVSAPVKHGIVWNLDEREWVHWDGNNNDPIARNIAAALGLGAPIVDTRAILDFPLVERHTDITQKIRAPAYPLPIDQNAAARGRAVYAAECASCHNVSGDKRLIAPEEVKTDPNRARQLDEKTLGYFKAALEGTAIDGFTPSGNMPFRYTGKYWVPDLAGVWARSPYLHNGSVRTLAELLSPSNDRSKEFRRGSRVFDAVGIGYTDAGDFLYQTAVPGNSNSGHEYGATLPTDQKRDLIEYLKTL